MTNRIYVSSDAHIIIKKDNIVFLKSKLIINIFVNGQIKANSRNLIIISNTY